MRLRREAVQPQVHYFVGGATTLELDNLYVMDTSFFPSIGAVNPALTAWPTPSGSASICLAGCRKPHPDRR